MIFAPFFLGKILVDLAGIFGFSGKEKEDTNNI
jgi:hypothetical protein